MSKTNMELVNLAKRHGLNISVDSLKKNESGLDFLVVMTTDEKGDRWVLRIPRRNDVIPTAKKEKKILELAGPKLSVQSPNWEVYSEELIAYKLLEGVPAGTIDPEAKAYIWELDEKNVPDSFHSSLGKAMSELHNSISHDDAMRSGIKVLTPENVRTSMEERMRLVKQEFGVGEELWQRWQRWLHNDLLWPQHTAFIHGDLHAGHILINSEAYVTGIIDWTEARVDDPINDFSVHYAAFGEVAVKKLFKEYEAFGGKTWPNMYQHLLESQAAYPVGIAEFALKSGLEEYMKMAKETLQV
ncbi:macrolide 2'-phosphotransferase [Cytobacillus purgationiresistens]|uniref:Macrolide phosphotransferase n=1 Tax=Cytobacillus purgationiresistens TaxID=863449 RepID=A0ABU0AN37_9BACI|nr:macrolide 2'-phosphotransferase [Cytobacillus purgationiresistens]MDQ0272657.1 macrolide phosphotransferase [Cytobacillus purgationiresistens]